ncbi:VOC family protein [Nocardia sp. alder85J]|uniref:VOC family protein n=1 Tax=Nocardia sp. alder85J TaxID=2862949 RepID=UPI00225298E8|nr:VOC family protein [Nocardia sp. alder85J]MCX4098123.1 VOC family protein [Nocardia sp. alder85J]
MSPLLDRIGLPGDEKSWQALGFDLNAATFRLGAVTCAVDTTPAWGFDQVHADPVALGIPVQPRAAHPDATSDADGSALDAASDVDVPADRGAPGAASDPDVPAGRDTGSPATHPNGATYVDHLVYWVPDLDDAVTALNAVLGTEPRRRFHPRGPSGPEMAFYRVGKPFLEVVSTGRPPILAGIAFGTPDLDATVAAVRAAGGPIGDPKPAVQGGRIASVWSGHVRWGIAFLEPAPR